MPADFQSSRVARIRTDPGRVIDAITRTSESVQRSTLAGASALAGGIASAGNSIAEGIIRRNDPAEELKRKAQAAQSVDLDNATKANAYRAEAKEMSATEAALSAGQASAGDPEAVVRAFTRGEWGVVCQAGLRSRARGGDANVGRVPCYR